MGKKNNSRKITVIEQQKEQAVLCATHICCSFGYNSETFGMKFIEWKWKKKEMCTQDKTLLFLAWMGCIQCSSRNRISRFTHTLRQSPNFLIYISFSNSK